MIAQPHFYGRAVGGHRGGARPRACSAQTESVFALSNGHIGLRANLDEGEPYGMPGHLPERVLRGASAALRRGRLRLPGGRADDRQRHQRQAHPAAGRRRALRRALRRRCSRTSARSTCAPACCAARSTGARRPGARSRCARRAWSPSCTARWPRSATRWSRSTARRGCVVQSELVANEDVPVRSEDPRAAAVLRAPLVAE